MMRLRFRSSEIFLNNSDKKICEPSNKVNNTYFNIISMNNLFANKLQKYHHNSQIGTCGMSKTTIKQKLNHGLYHKFTFICENFIFNYTCIANMKTCELKVLQNNTKLYDS